MTTAATSTAPERLRGLATVALVGLVVGLPLGTSLLELANGFALAAALAVVVTTRRFEPGPLAGPAAALAAGWMLLSLGPGGSVLTSLGRVWGLSAIWTVPVLLTVARPLPWDALGLAAAGPVAALAVLELALSAVRGHPEPSTGPFSHHLTLAYALVPPLFAAVGTRRPVAAAVIGGGVLSAVSAGGTAAVATGLAAVAGDRASPRRGAVVAGLIGVVATVAGLRLPQVADELRQRAVLWTGGATLALAGGAPPGTWRDNVDRVHRSLDPTFDFPQHSHDTLLQLAGDAGPGAWVAAAWAAWVLWERAPAWLLAAVAALAVGSLTQDVVGDLEVLRAVCVWTALGVAGAIGERPAACGVGT